MAGDGVEAVASQGSHLVERRTVAPGGCHERRLRLEPAALVLLQMSDEMHRSNTTKRTRAAGRLTLPKTG